jgi:hypothetical protein
VIASAPVDEEQVKSIINHVNEEFGLELERCLRIALYKRPAGGPP